MLTMIVTDPGRAPLKVATVLKLVYHPRDIGLREGIALLVGIDEIVEILLQTLPQRQLLGRARTTDLPTMPPSVNSRFCA